MGEQHIKFGDEQQEATWPGCMLVLATAIVAFPAGIVITMWCASRFDDVTLGLKVDDLPGIVKLIVGVVMYSPTVLTGLAFYYCGAAILNRCGVQLWQPRTESKRLDTAPRTESKPLGAEAQETTIGHLTLSEQEGRIIIRKSSQEYWVGLIVCLMAGPSFGLLCGWLAVLEWRRPGESGRDFFKETLHITLNLESLLPFVLALSFSLLTIFILALVAFCCCRELYREIRYGRRSWIFDPGRNHFSLGSTKIRRISSIEGVLISRLQVKFRYRYYVGFAPEDQPVADTLLIGLRDDVFSFGSEEAAEKFAAIIARFLGVGLAKEYE